MININENNEVKDIIKHFCNFEKIKDFYANLLRFKNIF